jgi:hypothetical protein
MFSRRSALGERFDILCARIDAYIARETAAP